MWSEAGAGTQSFQISRDVNEEGDAAKFKASKERRREGEAQRCHIRPRRPEVHTPDNTWEMHLREGRLVRCRARGKLSRMVGADGCGRGRRSVLGSHSERGLTMAFSVLKR